MIVVYVLKAWWRRFWLESPPETGFWLWKGQYRQFENGKCEKFLFQFTQISMNNETKLDIFNQYQDNFAKMLKLIKIHITLGAHSKNYTIQLCYFGTSNYILCLRTLKNYARFLNIPLYNNLPLYTK